MMDLRRHGIVAALAVLVPLGPAGPATTPAAAGEADVVAAEATPGDDGTWRFSVTVRHDDEGWDHYADAWEILGPDGAVLAVRVLHHPHEDEQPFTRVLSGVEIPETVTQVTVRAHDSVHGYGGAEVTVALPRP